MSNEIEIFEYLRSINCCKVCCLRYLNGRSEDFLDVDAAIVKRKLMPTVEEDENVKNQSKKFKENTCVACLGLFNEDNLKEMVESIKNNKELQEYKCDTFVTSISLPIVLHLRQLSIWIDLLDRFTEFKKGESPDVAVKDAMKMILNPMLGKAIERAFDPIGVMLNIFFSYKDEEKELSLLTKVKPEVFNERKTKRHCRKDFITRNAFEKNFVPTNLSAQIYKNHITVPPPIPDEQIVLEKVTFTGPTIFVAGRYNKVSRKLSQTPWILDGKRKMDNSVQEIIQADIAPYFNVAEETIIFSSSGREDVDVRCLGKGRPFVLEIPNAYKTILPEDIAFEMEKAVEKSKLVSIRDLQIVVREELVQIKTGEEHKKKFYRALCTLRNPVTVEVLKKLNIEESFVTHQVTPLRVLHRRPLHTRPRTIFSVKARVCKENERVLILDIVTQAGTYIKELVHSDFGRTHPSFKSIIGEWIDILALDVMAIDLDWPKEMTRE